MPFQYEGQDLADTTHPITAAPGAKRIDPHEVGTDVSRRDFLILATGAFAAVGVGGDALALHRPDEPRRRGAGARLDRGRHLLDRGRPVDHRDVARQAGLHPLPHRRGDRRRRKQVPLDELKDPIARNANLDSSAPATDENRAAAGKEQWLVMVGVCTHLGCVPLGQQGDYGGWFCPCHGSQYDTAGRIRSGPAPENLPIPPFAFTNDTTLRIG